MTKRRIVTGYRPTGKITLGHWFGNLMNMRKLQDETEAFFFVADLHALTSDWQNPANIRKYTEEMVLDWCAAGLDPERCTIYRQSDVPEVCELQTYFSMVLPMAWLERTPSYKEQKLQISDKDLGNVGFFLYPALMAADIALLLAEAVPVGADQLPHMELTREIVRRFNSTYGSYLIEPAGLIEEEGARVPGSDGRKMSKSYGNAIYLSDTPEQIRKTAMSYMTDPARKLKTDPGNPDICPLHQVHKLMATPEETAEWESCCRAATCGCVAHKKAFAETIIETLAPMQARRIELEAQEGFVEKVLSDGAARVRPIAENTLSVVRELVGIDAKTDLTAHISHVKLDESAPSFVDEVLE